MAKTKGKHAGGRPTKYRPEYCGQIVEFFDIEPTREVEITVTMKSGAVIEKTEERANPLRWLSGFARKIGVCHDTLLEWCNQHPEFSAAYARAKALQAEHLHTCGLLGLFDSSYARLAAINITDWRSEKHEHEHTGTVKHEIVMFGGNPDHGGRRS